MKKTLIIISVFFLAVFCGRPSLAAVRDKVIEKELNTVESSISREGRIDRALQDVVNKASTDQQNFCWDDICSTENKSGVRKASVELSVEDVYGKDMTPTKKVKAVKKSKVAKTSEAIEKLAQDRPDKYSFYDDYFVLDKKHNSVELGGEWFHYSYREEGFMKLDGTMKGVYAVYTHRADPKVKIDRWMDIFNISSYGLFNMLRIDTRYSAGHDIHYRSSGTGENYDEDHYVWETRAVVGYDLPLRDKVLITPYFGLGYRFLLDDNGGKLSTTGNWGYNRESRYLYMPIGIDVTRKLKHRWQVGVNMEYDYFVKGEQRSYFGDGPSASNYDTLVNNQNNGYGLRGSVKVVKEYDKIAFVFEPFARFWHIQDSETDFKTRGGQMVPAGGGLYETGLEPNNRTWEFGVKAGIKF